MRTSPSTSSELLGSSSRYSSSRRPRSRQRFCLGASRTSCSCAALSVGPFLEDPAVPVEGLVQILDLLLVDLRDPLRPGQAQLGILAELEAQAVDADQILPGVAADVHRLEQVGRVDRHLGIGEHPLEDGDGPAVIGLARQHRAQVAEGAVAIGELLELNLGQAEAQIDGHPGGDAVLEPTLQQIRQIFPATQLGVERLQRRHRLGVAALHRPDSLPGRDRFLVSPQLARQQRRAPA